MKSTLNYAKIGVMSHLILVSAILTIVASDYKSSDGLMNALISPSVIDAVVGEEIYLKITKPVAQQTKCSYRMSGGGDIDVRKPHKQNIEAWDKEICGLKINNVTVEDGGFWRLTSKSSTNNKDVARGIAYINVQSTVSKPSESIESTHDIDITPDRTTYCYVVRPDQTKAALPQHENCEFPKFDSDSEGNGIWRVVSGVKGSTHEVTFDVNVQTNVEELQTFVEHNAATASLNMKCKLANSNKTMKFCRFLRANDDIGFNLEEGRGEARYRYFGNGFHNRECGISIANADSNDKSPWKCLLGVEEKDEMKMLGAIIDGSDPEQPYAQGGIESSDVFGLENTSVNLLCKRNVQTDYCWFRDPSGRRISLSEKKVPQPSDTFSYYGTGIKLGECGLTILKATHNHSGTWSCHMGATKATVTDSFQEIMVRITETSLVSTNLIHDAQHGTSLLLECRAIPEHVPLDYCRFVLPDGTGFSINEKTTANNPHMDNYYFNPNRQLKSGYCSLIVKKLERDLHEGHWMCAAHLAGSDYESFDEFRVNVTDNDNSVAVAGITGMVFASIILIGAIIFITYKRYRRVYSLRRETVVTYVTNTDNISISSDQVVDLQHGTNENIELHDNQGRSY